MYSDSFSYPATKFPRKYGRVALLDRLYFLGNCVAATQFPRDRISCDNGLKQPHSVAQRSSSPRHRRTAAEDKVSVVTGNAIGTATPPAVVPATATAAPATAPVAYAATAAGSTIQLPAGQLLQTADGLVVYQGVQSSGNVAAQKTATIVNRPRPLPPSHLIMLRRMPSVYQPTLTDLAEPPQLLSTFKVRQYSLCRCQEDSKWSIAIGHRLSKEGKPGARLRQEHR